MFSAAESVRGISVPGGMNGSGSLGGSVTASLSGQQLASAIPSPTAGKSWRSKSMNLKHSATSSMLPSPTSSSSDVSDASKLGLGGGGGGPQRSMLDKFRLINPRSASRASPSVAEMALQEEDDLSEYGEDSPVPAVPACNSTAGSTPSKHVGSKSTASSLTPPNKASPSSSSSSSFSKSSSGGGGGSRSASRDKDEKSKSGRSSSKESPPPKDERDSFSDTAAKKTSKIGSLIPKGGKPTSGKKDSSGIPKPGLKAPSGTAHNPKAQSQPQVQGLNSTGNLRGGGGSDGERAKLMKGGGGQGGSFYMQRSIGGPMEGKRTSMTSSTSTSALSGSSGTLGGVGGGGGGAAVGGNGVVQLPQQQQHNHPNTATVAPFLYR